MKLFKIKTVEDNTDTVPACCETLRNPQAVLLLPTETVYGLMCRWDDAEAIARIRGMKRRDEGKPFQILSHDIRAIEAIGAKISGNARIIAEKFCPGPITIIVASMDASTIGFRIPQHGFMLELLKAHGRPLAATSANLSGEKPAANFADALKGLVCEPDIAVDGGEIGSEGLASTVVDLSGDEIKILRKGPISEEQIREAVFIRSFPHAQ